MRLLPPTFPLLYAVIVALSYLQLTSAVFPDEAYQVDYHHALLGTPQPATTFFHRPDPQSAASLIYTLSDKYILGAVYPKDGGIVWRQNISSSEHPNTTPLAQPVFGGENVVSAVGIEAASWTAASGKLIWKKFMTESVRDLKILRGTKDVAVMTADAVLLLDGATGVVKWEFRESR